MRCIDEERGPCAAAGVETRPPLGVFMVPVQPYSVEVYLPLARPKRAPFLRTDINNRAHHVSAVPSALATAAQARDAGRAHIAAPRGGEDRGIIRSFSFMCTHKLNEKKEIFDTDVLLERYWKEIEDFTVKMPRKGREGRGAKENKEPPFLRM